MLSDKLTTQHFSIWVIQDTQFEFATAKMTKDEGLMSSKIYCLGAVFLHNRFPLLVWEIITQILCKKPEYESFSGSCQIASDNDDVSIWPLDRCVHRFCPKYACCYNRSSLSSHGTYCKSVTQF